MSNAKLYRAAKEISDATGIRLALHWPNGTTSRWQAELDRVTKAAKRLIRSEQRASLEKEKSEARKRATASIDALIAERQIEELLGIAERERLLQYARERRILREIVREERRVAAEQAGDAEYISEAPPAVVGNLPANVQRYTNSKTAPRFIGGQEKRHGAYRRQFFTLEKGTQPDSTLGFFSAILDKVAEIKRANNIPNDHMAGVDIRYGFPAEGKDEERPLDAWRHQPIANTPQEMAEVAESVSAGQGTEGGGSDRLSGTSSTDVSSFYVDWWQPIVGGARAKYTYTKTKYYDCREPQKGHCLINCYRSVSSAKVSKNSTDLLIERGINPDDPLPLSAAVWLEELFQVSIPIWDGDSIEITREFQDSKKFGNRCTAHAEEVVLRQASDKYARAENALAIVHTKNSEGADHYTVALTRRRVELCTITGDELEEKPKTDAEIAARIHEQDRPLYGVHKKAFVAHKTRVLLYDLETVFDASTGELYPYCCAWYEYDAENPPKDFATELDKVRVATNLEPDRGLTNPLKKMLDYIEQCPPDTKYIIEAYNGASFDHLLLARAACERDRFSRLSWYNNKVYAGSIGRHTLHDLCRFTTASLKSACDSFATSPKKVDGFHHAIPQEAFFDGRIAWGRWLKDNKEKLENYVKNDVLSLGSLVTKTREAFAKLTGADVLKYPTIGKMAWDAWIKSLTDKEMKPRAAVSREDDQFMRKAMTAGRVEIVGNGGKAHIIEGSLRLFDYKSLYPTVCLAKGYGDEVFPYGPYKKVAGEQEGKLGIYACKVVSQPEINIAPKRGETLNWKCKEEFDTVLTSVDIAEIRRFGGEVQVGEGFAWSKSTNKLFAAYFTLAANEKQRQDTLKKGKSPLYNPALRECCKLLMNCLTGKVAQRERLGVCRIVKGAGAQHMFREKHTNITVVPLCGESVVMSGDPIAEKKWSQSRSKPSYLAAFIYSYARRCLYDMLPYSEYSDTDSALMTEEKASEFKAAHPERFPEEGKEPEFGHVDEELTAKKTSASYKAYLVQPKMYAVFAFDEKGNYDGLTGKNGSVESLSKIRSKGVKRSDIVLTDEEVTYIEKIATTPRERFFYHTTATSEGQAFGEEKNAEALMSAMCKGETAHVLCSQLTRSLKSKEGDHAFTITQRYILKSLTAGSEEVAHGLDDVYETND
jgi:hypothetical protein